MKAFVDGTKTLLQLAALVAAIAAIGSFQTRNIDRELVQSERRNAELHAKSAEDRDMTKRVQAANVARVAALEEQVKWLRAELAAAKGAQ